MQLFEVQVFQLFEEFNLLVQVDDVGLLAFDVTLHHWDASFAFLQLSLDRQRLFADFLADPAEGVGVGTVLDDGLFPFANRLKELLLKSFLIFKGVLQFLLLLDEVGAFLL